MAANLDRVIQAISDPARRAIVGVRGVRLARLLQASPRQNRI